MERKEDARQHPYVQALERRELRVGVISIDLIVILFLPLFAFQTRIWESPLLLLIDITAWGLDLASLILVLRTGKVEIGRALTLTAMTLLVLSLFFLRLVGGYGYIVLVTVPPALSFIGGKRFSVVMNSVYALVFALGVYGLIPVPWTIPDAPAVRFILAATYAMIGGIVIMLVRARAESYRTLMWTATHDPETELASLSTLETDAPQEAGSALLISLRNRDSIGSRFGIDTLRTVRATVAGRIEKAFSGRGAVCQFSETSVMVQLLVNTQDHVSSLVEEAVPELTAPVETEEASLIPEVSVAATMVEAGAPVESTIRDLVIALPVSHDRPSNSLVWFSKSIRDEHDLRIRTGDRLVEAIRAGALTTVYQPIVYADPNAVPDAEVLVRWNDEELGNVPPTRFVPIAEERGLIPALTDAVIGRSWRELGTALTERRIGALWINVSPLHLRSERFAAEFAQSFARHAVSPDYYSVELTEGALVDEQIVASGTLEGLRESGFRLSIDDFGTGYSNLDYLRRFDVDRLKIDRSFVSSAPTDPKAMTIVQAILSLAQSLGLGSVAEGVETEETCRAMRGMGVDACQGYFTGKPMDAPSLVGYLDGKLLAT